MDSKSKLELEEKLRNLQEEIWEKEKEVINIKKDIATLSVSDYDFETIKGKIKLSELFNDKSDLIVIHNMGKKCPYCTMWADGFNGLLDHIENRASFVVISPDAPDVQQQVANKRNWNFKMVSAKSNSFTKDMGFEFEGNKFMPGVSTFHKENGKITRTGMDFFGPGDNYNSPWHLFKLLKDGINEWHPRLKY
jgi:predicted dithiol-disulfide oxidoreductase (DUF899 family)